MVDYLERLFVERITVKELDSNYQHSLTLETIPPSGYEEHVGKIIALRPEKETKFWLEEGGRAKVKGYYALSREQDNRLLFDIYVSHSSRGRPEFPPRSLTRHIGEFVLKLINSGYTIPRDSLKPIGFSLEDMF